MAKINLLTPDIYGLISAGEVVDNPAGALKEVVENSIDAGARQITIEIENGGLDYICVTDDGCGIAVEDVENAFKEHATSKIATVYDLDTIQTLGFRGEALPSIAAVSKVKLTTRTHNSDVGVSVSVEGGVICDKQSVPANVGTRIEIRDLFYNTPARKKFLKSPAREGVEITKFVTKLILANPYLKLTYTNNGKVIYRTQGTDLSEAIFAVYGADCISNCLPINYTRGNLRIQGYICTPEYSKSNKLHQFLSVNGRCVADVNISSAIAQAYRKYLMQRQFPMFVLNLDIPCDIIDVNVHPRKNEIRFADLSSVCSAFYHATLEALEQYDKHKSSSTFYPQQADEEEQEPSEQEQIPQLTRQECDDKLDKMEQEGFFDQLLTTHARDMVEQIERETQKYENQVAYEKMLETLNEEVSVAKSRERLGLPPLTKKPTFGRTSSQPQTPVEVKAKKDDEYDKKIDYDNGVMSRLKILGAVFNTYLAVELDDKFILIDQHAAHERILYERFMAGKLQTIQNVMIPYVFYTKPEEAEFLRANTDNIHKAGIELEEFGENTFRITAVSTLLTDVQMNVFVEYLLSSVNEFRLDDSKLVVEAIAKKACKAAVKAGQALNEHEINYILTTLIDEELTQCPHGRPITVTLTKTQIEKMFKRIV